MTSFIAFHETRGIYLGVYLGYALFSNSPMAFSSKAIRFDTEADIRDFFVKTLPILASEIVALSVETTSDNHYVDVIEIIKSGHTKHTERMVENLPMLNETIH
jgi:hypothetical protein